VLSDTEQNTMLEILHDGVTAYELAKDKTDQIEDFIQLLRSKPKV
jgi:phage tail sheath gpL-like